MKRDRAESSHHPHLTGHRFPSHRELTFAAARPQFTSTVTSVRSIQSDFAQPDPKVSTMRTRNPAIVLNGLFIGPSMGDGRRVVIAAGRPDEKKGRLVETRF